MTLTADQIVDRRRLRRTLFAWRFVAFVAIAVLLVAGVLAVIGGERLAGLAGPQIARIGISGFITDDRDQLELLDRLARNDSVRGVIVAIDSPGGTSAGGEALYEALRRVAGRKPTVAVVGTTGASAAYMAAIATDHIVARRSSITGSIGVIFQYPEISQLLDRVGVDVEEVTSGPLKGQPSFFRPASPEATDMIAGVVGDTYQWFAGIVAERRGLDPGDAATLTDGRIFTGRQALEAKLIDEIGGEREALRWLGDQGVNRRLPIRDWKAEDGSGGFPFADALAIWMADRLGLPPAAIRDSGLLDELGERLKLDGLMSVWQAPAGGWDGPAGGAPR